VAVAAGGSDQCLAGCREVGEEAADLAAAQAAIPAEEDLVGLAEGVAEAAGLREAGRV
jgi:hypothetical protein